MPVNAPVEYFKAEDRFRSAKSREEKIAALEEMIRLLPRHHGSENAHAQLRSKLAKLKKETKKKGGTKTSIAKEGEAQVCLIGYTKSGKSWLLSKLTHAKPKISETPFTTTKPEVGMMDYEGVKIQIVEIPSTFEPEHLSIARSCDLVVLVSKGEDIKKLENKSQLEQEKVENLGRFLKEKIKSLTIGSTISDEELYYLALFKADTFFKTKMGAEAI